MNCKITNTKITPFMSFGKMPIANGFINKKNFKKEYFYKMEVGFSKKISLVQLINHPKPKQTHGKSMRKPSQNHSKHVCKSTSKPVVVTYEQM